MKLIEQSYGRAKAKFSFVSGLYGQLQNLAFIYGDFLPKFWGFSGFLLSRYLPARFQGEIAQTLVFIFGFNIISTILSLPISYYSTFVLEEKFGFNKQTLKLWLTDMLKGQMLGIVLGTPIISAVLKIVQKTGGSFFYYLWLFGVFVQVFAITIYPIAILPLFNKLSPLQPGALKTGVENLARKLEFPLQELYVIDGSKRSAHSNAYFFGLPWKKHIVIYDTLIEKSEPEEVVAVLGHELGHWSLSHTTKLFGIAQVWPSYYPGRGCTLQILTRVVSHVLYLCALLGFHQQQVSLPVVWFLQRAAHHGWIPSVLGCLGSHGRCGPALDEHSQSQIRV